MLQRWFKSKDFIFKSQSSFQVYLQHNSVKYPFEHRQKMFFSPNRFTSMKKATMKNDFFLKKNEIVEAETEVQCKLTFFGMEIFKQTVFNEV